MNLFKVDYRQKATCDMAESHPIKQRKRKSIAQKTPNKTEKHVLDNPYKTKWPKHTLEITEKCLYCVKSKISERYSTACSTEPTLGDLRGKRNFGHRLERNQEFIFSINCITRLFENNFDFRAVFVEETLIPTKIFDHILYFCGLRKVALVKGCVSVSLSPCLGRKRVAIAAVPASSDLEFGSLEVPVLPFTQSDSLPDLFVRIVDVTPSAKAVEKKRLKTEKKKMLSEVIKMKLN